ncbi:MAG: haloacid dehalogenase-like hydrolase [Planctomycetaceae bacterium]|nr:haloacid dehalogenase-like hydrolase [Planctomycetaceae bacterium]
MRTNACSRQTAALVVAALCLGCLPRLPAARGADPLPSWNEGPAKRAIVELVDRTTRADSPDFVPVPDRIATFDNDGTLWCEHPMYVQGMFVIDRLKELLPRHPEWKERPNFRAAFERDLHQLALYGENGLAEIVMATHAEMTVDEFLATVRAWMAQARHPRFQRPYTELVYQPMLELLAYLRAHGYTTCIVTGGGIEFVRAWAEPIYGIPPGQIVGSSIRTKFQLDGDAPRLLRLPEIDFIDDGPGKPVGINKFLGKVPIAAFGNSDGDLQMLEYTTVGRPGKRLGMIVHHTDAEREYAYDRDTRVVKLERALTAAPARGWIVVDMRRDWRRIFAFEK